MRGERPGKRAVWPGGGGGAICQRLGFVVNVFSPLVRAILHNYRPLGSEWQEEPPGRQVKAPHLVLREGASDSGFHFDLYPALPFDEIGDDRDVEGLTLVGQVGPVKRDEPQKRADATREEGGDHDHYP